MDIKRLQELAGLEVKSRVITEAVDDDDDPDAKVALSDKRQQEFERKNAGELSKADKAARDKAAKAKAAKAKADAAEKAMKAAKAEKKGEKPAAPKAEEKKETPAEEKKEVPKAEEKKEAPAAKAKGRKTSERGGSCRTWLSEHPGATRGQFIAHCADQGMSKAHANTLFYSLKKKATANEAWMVFHPMVGNFVLAENTYSGRYQWVGLDEETGFAPMVFESVAAARKVVNDFDSFGFTPGVIKQVVADGELVDD